ncbi:MAG: c-type cytochrome [Pseudomonadota bacterium]
MIARRPFRIALGAMLALGAGALPAQEAPQADTVAETALGDAEMGEDIYKKSCRGCHGPTAKGLASYPTLRDQTFDYLVDRLERYRAGERFGPNTPLMAPRAKKLSDEDIANISTFIVSLE